MSEKKYLRCPNCGSEILYVERPDESLVFIRIDLEGHPENHKNPSADISDLDLSVVYCTSCGWYGRVDELAGPETA